MPASLPGETLANNQGNPALGDSVQFDLLSGPKGSPFDAKKIDYTTGSPPGWDAATRLPITVNDPLNLSTGPLSTGIGMNTMTGPIGLTAPASIKAAGFTDDYTPGVTKPDGIAATASMLMYIGGGKTSIVAGTGANGNGYPASWRVSVPAPYVAGFGIGNAGNGGSRDAGAGPAFTGFVKKMVTATAPIANGVAIEAGFINRTGGNMAIGQSAFGSSTAASAAPA